MSAEPPDRLVLASVRLFYRAFFVLPRTITGPDGVPTGAAAPATYGTSRTPSVRRAPTPATVVLEA